ncbi:IL24 isoform 2 [Pongo abelii]|uniref:IL24 isoform 2 n=1 Tax=Pongo abelii TaxID=9601 RepID=A0A2J8V6S0_PONAB|nr:IL24 isoform 2 [Pongo abelii]
MNFQQRLQSLWSLASKLRITSRVCGCCSRRFCRMSRMLRAVTLSTPCWSST